MSIYFGNDTVNDLYIGLIPVSKGYVGTHLFYNGDNTIIDLTYEKYILNTQFNTLYNTEEAPIKSAILKGNTLVNLVKTSVYGGIQSGTCVDGDTGYKVIESIVNTGAIILTRVKTIHPLSPSTVYYLKLTDVAHTNSFLVREQDNGVNSTTEIHDLENKIIKFTTSELGTSDLLFYQRGLQVGAKVKYEENFILSVDVDSLYNADDYFTGIRSVKMPVLTTTGKNLCGGLELGSIASADGSLTEPSSTRLRTKDFITLYPGSYSISANKNYEWAYRIYDMNGVFLSSAIDWGVNLLTVTENSKVKLIVRKNNNGSVSPTDNIVLQVEEGSTATSYEPHKSNILTTSEEVELRGIGDVKDELNLLTMEVTEKIREVTLDGGITDEVTYKAYNGGKINEGYSVFTCSITPDVYGKREYSGKWASTFPLGRTSANDWKNGEYVGGAWYGATSMSNIYVVKLLTSSLSSNDVNGFKEYLQHNPITIQYELETESVKTVDLSVVNQDGNSTKLSTFDDITHVTLSSEGCIPEAELEVATKNEEVLSTMSLEMNDISTTQNALQETSNIQSENVDSTMIATTEIYEGLL